MPFKTNDILLFIDFFNFLKVRNKFGIIHQNYAFIGLFLLVQIGFNFNSFLFPTGVLFFIGMTSDLIVTALFFNFFRKTYTILWALIHNLTIGMIIIYLFLWTNENLTTKPLIREVIRIDNVDINDHYKRRGIPAVKFNVHGVNKEIEFSTKDFKRVMFARQVMITTRQGYWGYSFITDVELVDSE